ncbi:LCP family protein [Lactobacillus sp. DCY120]|uniref:LCP family protein n=1 Tax=Bombilactobacillus apium TaxID=2675299 RepID=A0A850R6E5_9LACO|nr:LCP family protein [Bombilactobacillus apium]NVY96212.1 LCP family protein [Bombilactobacillus apium]
MDKDQPNKPQFEEHHHRHHSKRRHHRRFHPWRWLGVIVLLFLFAGGSYAWYIYHNVKTTADGTYIPLNKSEEEKTKDQSNLKNKKPLSILIMGTDTGALGRTEARGRTDTLILMTVNPQTKKTTMTSIPRDTMAQMMGSKGINIQKINAAYSLGGADESVKSVSTLLNVPIQQYAVINMGGLEKIVDAVGGVDIDVPFSFKSEQDHYKHQFTKGKMHLDGSAALAYVRMRYEDPRGDYGRAQRQRQVITAILEAAPSMNTLSHFKTLTEQVKGNFRTSLSFEDMIKLYQNYRPATAKIEQDFVQGVGAYLNGSSYQIASTPELQRVSKKIRQNLGLKEAPLKNEETKQNALNPDFNWQAENSSGYEVQGADKVN